VGLRYFKRHRKLIVECHGPTGLRSQHLVNFKAGRDERIRRSRLFQTEPTDESKEKLSERLVEGEKKPDVFANQGEHNGYRGRWYVRGPGERSQLSSRARGGSCPPL